MKRNYARNCNKISHSQNRLVTIDVMLIEYTQSAREIRRTNHRIGSSPNHIITHVPRC